MRSPTWMSIGCMWRAARLTGVLFGIGRHQNFTTRPMMPEYGRDAHTPGQQDRPGCSARGVVSLFEAGCGVAIATAGRTSGQCYYRVPRFRGRAVAIREPSLPACGGCCWRGWADCPARCRVREPPSLLATGRSWKPVAGAHSLMPAPAAQWRTLFGHPGRK